MKEKLLVLFIAILSLVSCNDFSPIKLYPVYNLSENNGIIPVPQSKFLLHISPSALGSTLGVIYNGPELLKEPWHTRNKFWQVPDWSEEIVSVYALASGTYLLVSTSGIYSNTPGIYLINLSQKEYERIYPTSNIKEQMSYNITSIDNNNSIIYFEELDVSNINNTPISKNITINIPNNTVAAPDKKKRFLWF